MGCDKWRAGHGSPTLPCRRPLEEGLAVAARVGDPQLSRTGKKQHQLMFYQESSCQAIQVGAHSCRLHGMAWLEHGMAWHGPPWAAMAWHGRAWGGMACRCAILRNAVSTASHVQLRAAGDAAAESLRQSGAPKGQEEWQGVLDLYQQVGWKGRRRRSRHVGLGFSCAHRSA